MSLEYELTQGSAMATNMILDPFSSLSGSSTLISSEQHNARLTEQIFDGGFFACYCKKGDSGNLSGAAAC
jgi:hypothetical protein